MNEQERIERVDIDRPAAQLVQLKQDATASEAYAEALSSPLKNRKRRALQMPIAHIEEFAEAIADELMQYKAELSNYDWEIGDGVLDYADQELNIRAVGVSVLEKTESLRDLISKDARANWDREDRGRLIQLAEFVIRRWGGLDGNKDETIAEYVDRFWFSKITSCPEGIDGHAELFERAKQQGILWQFTNIASWSKWLNFVWPEWALIYDARIAFGLNAIHFLRGLETPVFPQPPGRNSLLGNLDAQALAVLRRNAVRQETPPNDAKKAAKWFQQQQFRAPHAYPIYLEVMSQAHELLWADKEPKPPLVHTEMLLFRVSANQLALKFARAVMKALANGPRP